MGVKRAVDMVLDIAQRKGQEKLYTYGPLIHNPQTVEILRRRGIVPVDRIEEIDSPTENTTLIIRAHGISPAERKEIKDRGIRIIDATCPKVAHVQAIIKKYASLDYTILIVGDEEHPEVNGLLGYAEKKGIVLSRIDDVNHLSQIDKVCIVAQTTQNMDLFKNVVEAIKSKCPDAVVFDTICDSTEKRQTEVKHLCNEMDAIVIVGGRNSANTRQLASISKALQKPTFHIETSEELKDVSINGYKKIGISAGASTPNWIIDSVVDNITNKQKESDTTWFFKLWLFCIKTDIYAAVGAGSLSLASMLLQRIDVNILNICIASFYVYAMHNLNRIINIKSSSLIGSFREDSYRGHEKVYIYTALLSLIIALTCSFLVGASIFILLFIISLLGVIYNAQILPKGMRFSSLKDIPGSKNIAMALAWASVAALLPQLAVTPAATAGMIVAFLYTFGVVFVCSSMSDVLDIQSDRLIGRETIPVLIGKEKTQMLMEGILISLIILLTISHPMGWTSSLTYVLLVSIFFIWIYFNLYDRRPTLSGIVLEGILETNYILAGLSAFFWWLIIS